MFVFQVWILPSLKRQGEPLNGTVTMFPHPPEGRGRETVGRHGPGSPRGMQNLCHYRMESWEALWKPSARAVTWQVKRKTEGLSHSRNHCLCLLNLWTPVITKNMNLCLLLEMKPFHMLPPEVGYPLTRGSCQTHRSRHSYENILSPLPSSSLRHGLDRWTQTCGPPHSAPCVDRCVPWISVLESIPGSAFLNFLLQCLFSGSDWTTPKNRTQHINRSSVSVVAPAMRLSREEVGREVCTSPKYTQSPIERRSLPHSAFLT